MNEKPHAHDPNLTIGRVQRRNNTVTYGDTTVKFHTRNPGPRRTARLTKRAIKRHDRNSLKAGKRDAALKGVQSSWWMSSPERMEKLHAEALREEDYRNGKAKTTASDWFSQVYTNGTADITTYDAPKYMSAPLAPQTARIQTSDGRLQDIRLRQVSYQQDALNGARIVEFSGYLV